MANAVAKAKETAVATDVMDDILEFAGEGASFDSSEMQIPFVKERITDGKPIDLDMFGAFVNNTAQIKRKA